MVKLCEAFKASSVRSNEGLYNFSTAIVTSISLMTLTNINILSYRSGYQKFKLGIMVPNQGINRT